MRRYDEELLRQLYDYIMDYQQTNSKSPSYRMIAKHLPNAFSSTAKIGKYLTVLENRELIERECDGAIKVNPKFRTKTVNAPIVGKVACGQPIEAIENIEGSFALPAEIFGSRDLMLLKADGMSMKIVGIEDGDYIIIRRQETADSGDMVLALLGNEATVKTYYPQKNGKIVLHPENEQYQDIVVEDCMIQGIVVGCLKRYR